MWPRVCGSGDLNAPGGPAGLLASLEVSNLGVLGGSKGKESASVQETWAQSLHQEDPMEKGMATIPVLLLREFHSLVGYSPWGCKESDKTEQLTHMKNQIYLNHGFNHLRAGNTLRK